MAASCCSPRQGSIYLSGSTNIATDIPIISLINMQIILWTACFLKLVHGLIECDQVLREADHFTGACSNQWSDLKPIVKPTQSQVGYAWIKYKLNTNFKSAEKAAKLMDKTVTPAVIGPDAKFYIVDDHHTLSSLDFSGYDSTSVTLTVICDKRHLNESQFWEEMKEEKLVYLIAHPHNNPNALPVSIQYSDLPTSFSFTESLKTMSDDPWRSIAGLSSKVTHPNTPVKCIIGAGGKYCQRCFNRGCEDGSQKSGPSVPFFEFRWAYYMNLAYDHVSYWPSDIEWQWFHNSYTTLPAPSDDLKNVNTSSWFGAANTIIALCRSQQAGEFRLPTELYGPDRSLPGFVHGYMQLSEPDPQCSIPSCSVKKESVDVDAIKEL
jgi:hypothetical protein